MIKQNNRGWFFIALVGFIFIALIAALWWSVIKLGEKWDVFLLRLGLGQDVEMMSVAAIGGTIILAFLFILLVRQWQRNQSRVYLLQKTVDEHSLKLGLSEEQYRRYAFIVNSSYDLMSLIDRDYKYEAVNDAYCKNYGYPREEIIGKTAADIWGKENFKLNIKEHLDRCFEGNTVHYESWFAFPGGESRYYEITFFPYAAEDMKVTHAVAISRDVTGEMMSEKELQRAVYVILFLNRLIEAVSSSLDTDAILSIICRELANALNVPQVAFAKLDDDRHELCVTAEYFVEGCASALGTIIPVTNNPQTEYVISNRLPLVVRDVEREGTAPVWKEIQDRRGTASMLIVPVFVRGMVFGTLGLDSLRKREFTADEIALAQSVASIASQALENARLYNALHLTNTQLTSALESLAKRTHLNTLMHEMGDSLQNCEVMQDAYPIIQEYARVIFADSSGALFIYDQGHNALDLALAWGKENFYKPSINAAACAAFQRSSEAHHGAFISPCSQCIQDYSVKDDSASMCLPLSALGQILGVLYVCDIPLSVPEDWQQKMYAFAERRSLSLGNLKLRYTLQTQSIQDPLTGLYNRRYLKEALVREVQRAVRHKRSFGVIMMDIDKFKVFNDTFGHDAGDEVLRELSKYLMRSIRAEDIVCRYGGEEFLVIISESSAEDTYQRALELLEGVRGLQVMHEGKQLSVRVSAGVAMFPLHGDSAEAVIHAADLAMLRAKREGRNRVMLAGDDGAG